MDMLPTTWKERRQAANQQHSIQLKVSSPFSGLQILTPPGQQAAHLQGYTYPASSNTSAPFSGLINPCLKSNRSPFSGLHTTTNMKYQ
jgi:hypothetical protein